jgi:DNA recombination protein RmuC
MVATHNFYLYQKISGMEWIYVIPGFVAGAFILWLVMRARVISADSKMSGELAARERENGLLAEKLAQSERDREKLLADLEEERRKTFNLSMQLTRLGSDYENLNGKLTEQKTEIESLQKKFTTEFENIANKILRENSREFTHLNQKNINDLLSPLKDKIEKFEKKVEETYEKGYKDQDKLRLELQKLHELNTRISEEASNLTRALKSDSKKMGNWGELILDRILEQSGLEKGKEYFTQFTDRSEDGTILRPDVVVMLPDKKHIIIDSKVSLVAYDRYVNTQDDTGKERALRAHLESVREHVRGLSEKNYTEALSIDSPDFVLLFMPLESAFSLAIQQDPEIFNFAWQRKIVIVSPTTLLATLKTVESIWKHEKQTQNAMEIARQGAGLYDKFYNFVTDLEKIGGQINSLQNTYLDAHKKLTSGKGNLVRQAERLKELGVKTDKSLARKILPENEE